MRYIKIMYTIPTLFSKNDVLPAWFSDIGVSPILLMASSSCWSRISSLRSTPVCFSVSGTVSGLCLTSCLAWALVVTAPTMAVISGSSGFWAPGTFPTRRSYMTSGMHSASTSPDKVSWLESWPSPPAVLYCQSW